MENVCICLIGRIFIWIRRRRCSKAYLLQNFNREPKALNSFALKSKKKSPKKHNAEL